MICVCIGAGGTGKTFLVNSILQKIKKQTSYSTVVVNPFNDSTWAKYKSYPPSKLFSGGDRQTTIYDKEILPEFGIKNMADWDVGKFISIIKYMLIYVMDKVPFNIVFDDASIITPSSQKDVEINMLLNGIRQKGANIFFMYHGLYNTPVFVLMNVNIRFVFLFASKEKTDYSTIENKSLPILIKAQKILNRLTEKGIKYIFATYDKKLEKLTFNKVIEGVIYEVGMGLIKKYL